MLEFPETNAAGFPDLVRPGQEPFLGCSEIHGGQNWGWILLKSSLRSLLGLVRLSHLKRVLWTFQGDSLCLKFKLYLFLVLPHPLLCGSYS